jgi:hypothetical protein
MTCARILISQALTCESTGAGGDPRALSIVVAGVNHPVFDEVLDQWSRAGGEVL